MNREPAIAFTFVQRIVLLAILFVAELLAISVWLDTAGIAGRGGLTGFVSDWGPRVLESVVAFATLLVTFAFLRARDTIERLSAEVAVLPISWQWLAGHLGAMAGFALLSARLFGKNAGPSTDAMAGGWLLAGVLGIVLAAIAILPASVWLRLIRDTGPICIAAVVAGIGAALFSHYGEALWNSMAGMTFSVVRATLGLCRYGVVSDPDRRLIGTTEFQVIVAPECSGLEGIGLILIFSIVWLWFFRNECRFPRALLVIPVGVLAMWLLNALRITALILIGNAGARGIALGGFHSQAGWIAFNGVALGFSLAFRRVPWLMAVEPKHQSRATENPAAAYMVPFLVILAAAMVSRAASSGFEWLYPLRLFAAAVALWIFRRRYAALHWQVSWMAPVAGVVVFGMWLALDWARHGHADGTIGDGLAALSLSGRIVWLVCRVTAAAVTVPIAEEFAFRGFFIRRLMSADFDKLSPKSYSYLAILISSVAFGMLHGGRWIAGTLAGMIYAVTYLRRGSIGDSAVAHGITNGLLAVWVLAAGRWDLW